MNALDQLFVNAKHLLVGWMPEGLQTGVSLLVSAAAIIGAYAGLFAITTWLERKGLARLQNRMGPNRVGPFGLLQPMADGIKAIIKEDIIPYRADRLVHTLAPIAAVVPSMLALALIPAGRNMVAVDLEAGLVFFFAMGGVKEIAVFMAGWGSRNAYSLLGSMRGIAQMISYEMPLVLSGLVVAMAVGSLSLVDIVEAQAGYHAGILARWHVFTPWGLGGFLLFMVAATAESNRTPFDLPEGESEIIAGHMLEYSGFKYALFFLGEYMGLFAVSGLAITLFLGGWQAPFSFLAWVPSWLWFFGKLFCFIALFIWLRGTLPRLRADQLMEFAYKFMLPMVLVNLVAVALWRYTAGWTIPGAVVVRWLMCAALLFLPFLGLGKLVSKRPKGIQRTYRFAD